jgi:hypothetical protein
VYRVQEFEHRLRLAQICLLILACIWGADYLLNQPSASLDAVEHVLPLHLLGAMFLLFGVMGIIGELWMEIGNKDGDLSWSKMPYICTAENRWWPSFTAHLGLCGIYAGLGFAYIAEMLAGWHLWGGHDPALMFVLAAMHGVFVRRRRHVRF